MRYVWAIVCALMISTSSPAFTGGMSGGTGIGGLIQEITEEIQALLKHPIKIDKELVRRLIMRLWVYGEAEIKIGDKIIHIKWKYKHNVNEDPNKFDITIIAGATVKDAPPATDVEAEPTQ
jgi:hypothetical protein